MLISLIMSNAATIKCDEPNIEHGDVNEASDSPERMLGSTNRDSDAGEDNKSSKFLPHDDQRQGVHNLEHLRIEIQHRPTIGNNTVSPLLRLK